MRINRNFLYLSFFVSFFSLSQEDVVIESIWDSAKKNAQAKVVEEEVDNQPTVINLLESDDGIRLLKVVIPYSDDKSVATILINNSISVYREGDRLGSNYEIVSIRYNSVSLKCLIDNEDEPCKTFLNFSGLN